MFSKSGVGWVYDGFFGVDVSEDAEVDIVLVTHHHRRHVAGARKAKKVVINQIEYGMATDYNRALRYTELMLKRAGAPKDAKVNISVGPFSGVVYRFTAGWVDLGDLSVRVIPCGSHTWGHTCYGLENVIFVGDLDSWIVSVNTLINVMSSFKSLKNYMAYTSRGERIELSEYISKVEYKFKKLLAAYIECIGEKTPYEIARCVRGDGDVLRLSEEGIAFVKYLAENGYVKIVASSPYLVKPSR